jgi:hypothetical protein
MGFKSLLEIFLALLPLYKKYCDPINRRCDFLLFLSLKKYWYRFLRCCNWWGLPLNILISEVPVPVGIVDLLC